MDLRNEIQRLAHQFEREDSAAHNLWTWLPSHAAAQKGHGDHAGNFRPSIADVMEEACEFISHRLHPTAEQRSEAGELYECPCGQTHDDEQDTSAAASTPIESPATFDAFIAEMRNDIELFAKHWKDGHRSNPDQYPMSFPSGDAGAWFEQFMAFVNQ